MIFFHVRNRVSRAGRVTVEGGQRRVQMSKSLMLKSFFADTHNPELDLSTRQRNGQRIAHAQIDRRRLALVVLAA